MDKIYQLKIILNGSAPEIWRKILVNEDINLHKLHEVFQAVMGWEDDHMYVFKINGKKYEGQPEYDEEDEKENKVTRGKNLNQLIDKENQEFLYVYDYGDNWEHRIILEQITEKEPDKFYPVCVAGENACPPENTGGILGYYNQLERLKKGELSEDEIDVTFGDEEFNPEEFDIEHTNEELREYFIDFKTELYEQYPEPVRKLLELGETERKNDWSEYSQMGFTEKDIPKLIEMFEDLDLEEADSDTPYVWAPLHAWRTLGGLKAKEAIRPIINKLDEIYDDDWASEELPRVLGLIGEDCIEPLSKYIYDKSKSENARINAMFALQQVGENYPDKKDGIIKIFSEYLDNASAKNTDLNGFAVLYLIELNAESAIESIRSAFERNIVEISIPGDLEDVEIALGLRLFRSTPKPKYNRQLTAPTQPDASSGKVKIGRNDPCPCGSGKKYKKCCLP